MAVDAARSETNVGPDIRILREIGKSLAAVGVPCCLDEAAGNIKQEFTFFPQDATKYRRADGAAVLELNIEVTGDGRHVLLSAPAAWPVNARNKDAVLETALIIQEKSRRVRFGYDPLAKALCPRLEVDLHDGDSVANQALTGIRELFSVVVFYDHIIRSVMECRNPDLDRDAQCSITHDNYKRLGQDTFARLHADCVSKFAAVKSEVIARLQSLAVLHNPKVVATIESRIGPIAQSEAAVVIYDRGVLGLGGFVGPKFREAVLRRLDDTVNDVLGMTPCRAQEQTTNEATLAAANKEMVNREMSDA